jgi:DNA replication and repair protein RecF
VDDPSPQKPIALVRIAVRHFRCFERFETEFAPELNFIVGPNARGKTSLLEAACILLRLQSPRVTRLLHAIQHERRGFVVDGYLGPRHLQFYFGRDRKKLALDGVAQTGATEYLAIGRVIYFSNSDSEIVSGPNEIRRRFLDFVAVQRDSAFRQTLRDFEKVLRSRNLLLKAPSPSWRQIDAFAEPFVALGNRITAARRALVAELQEPVDEAHRAISGGDETVGIEYVPGFADPDLGAALQRARGEDARLRQSTIGPHRDDLRFFLNGRASDLVSEGQRRTLVLALKLGAARLFAMAFGVPPIFLLDDTFGELDVGRRNALLAALPLGAQKLITTTHLDWMEPGRDAHLVRLG